jgi:hypothetical protein
MEAARSFEALLPIAYASFHGVVSQNTGIFLITAVRTSNLAYLMPLYFLANEVKRPQ